jgi:signal transduction histidine kinase
MEEPMPPATSTSRRSNPAPRLRVKQPLAQATDGRPGEGRRTPAQLLSERARIAREVHDVLAHSLSALGVQIETARSVLVDRGDIPAAICLLEHAGHLADNGLSETRRVVHALRADTPPLPDALDGLADRHQRDYQRPVALSITGPPGPIRPDTTMALLLAAQEALTNAARHAPAATVTISLDYTTTEITLTVSNQAPLCALRAASGDDSSGSGFGLVGMRERLHLAGGTLTAGRVGDEWVVRAQVPR